MNLCVRRHSLFSWSLFKKKLSRGNSLNNAQSCHTLLILPIFSKNPLFLQKVSKKHFNEITFSYRPSTAPRPAISFTSIRLRGFVRCSQNRFSSVFFVVVVVVVTFYHVTCPFKIWRQFSLCISLSKLAPCDQQLELVGTRERLNTHTPPVLSSSISSHKIFNRQYGSNYTSRIRVLQRQYS